MNHSENHDTEKKSLIIIINGKGGSGKDTLINEYQNHHLDLNILNISSIDPIKKASYFLGESKYSNKTDKYRQFLAKLKQISTEYNDYPFTYVKNQIYYKTTGYWFNECSDKNINPCIFIDIYFVHIREPEEIEKLVNWCHEDNMIRKYCTVKTLLVTSSRTEDKVYGNASDDNVNSYDYDIIIDNSDSIEETFKVFDDTIDSLLNSQSTKDY